MPDTVRRTRPGRGGASGDGLPHDRAAAAARASAVPGGDGVLRSTGAGMARFLDAVVTGSAPGSMPQAFAMTEAETFFMPDHPGRGIGLGWFCGMLRPSAGTPRMAEARDSARRSRSCLHDGRACSLRPTRKALTFSPSSPGCSVWWGRAEREPGWPTSRKPQRGEGASGGLAMTYLIRHGEKLGNPADERPGGPCVSEMGSARTVALRSLVQDGGRGDRRSWTSHKAAR